MSTWRRRLVAPLAVAAVAGGGWAAYAETGGSAHSYRTATATVGDVSATLDLSGTVSASGKADLVASTSGEVVAVPVRVGQRVRRGQVIARLDQTALAAQVMSARAALAKATAQLAADEKAQTSAVAATTRTTTRTTTLTTARTAGADPLAALRHDQAAVIAAQSAASAALATSAQALGTEQSACAATATATTSPTATDSATASESASSSPVGDDCQTALGAVESAQAAVADAQAALKSALDTLTADLAKALASAGSTAGGPNSPTGSTTTAPSASSGDTTVTAATLARDQASIDQARADLVSALAARRAAVVRAPAAGQVRALSVAKGDVVSTGDAVAIVVGKGLTTVEIAASQTQAAELAVGGTARVTPAGSTTALAGRVSRIAHVPTTSSTSSTGSAASTASTYAVEVTLRARRATLPPLGMPVAVSAVVGTATKVVTVPASAVSNGSVEVLAHGEVTRTRVTTGVVGASTIQVLSGLRAGQQVVLADLDEALPTTGSSTIGRGFTGGGFGGPPGMG